MSDSPEESFVSQLIGLIKQQNEAASEQRGAQLTAINNGFGELRIEIRMGIRYAALMGIVTIAAVVVLAGGTVWLKTASLEVSAHADSVPVVPPPTPPLGPVGAHDQVNPNVSVLTPE